MNIYIAGAIDGADRKYHQLYERLGAKLKEFGHEVFVPHLESKDLNFDDFDIDRRIYRKDDKALNNADLMLAYIGERSTGLGAELVQAILNEKTILCFYDSEHRPSRYITGLLKEMGQVISIVPDLEDTTLDAIVSAINILSGARRLK
jgi:nucleoside 2-deoxyribosyltransferase